MAVYLSVLAWSRNLDCVAIDRDEIVRLWGIVKRVENQRLDWLKCDIKHYFPFFEALWFTQGTKKFGSLFLARRDFPANAFDGSLSDEKRAQALTGKGFNTEVVQLPSEVNMLTHLTAVTYGLVSVSAPAVKTLNQALQPTGGA